MSKAAESSARRHKLLSEIARVKCLRELAEWNGDRNLQRAREIES